MEPQPTVARRGWLASKASSCVSTRLASTPECHDPPLPQMWLTAQATKQAALPSRTAPRTLTARTTLAMGFMGDFSEGGARTALAPRAGRYSARNSGPRAEQGHAGGEAVDEVAAPDRPDLAGGEEPGGGHRLDERGLHAADVVVGAAEHARPASVAGEQERALALRLARAADAALAHQVHEVLARGLRVAHQELHRHAHADRAVPDRDRALLRVEAHQPAHQEVAAREAALARVDRQPQEGLAREQLSLGLGERAHGLHQRLDRLLRAELEQEVLLAAGDDPGLADRTAALADDRAHLDVALDRHADGGALDHAVLTEDQVLSGARAAAGHPADALDARVLGVEQFQVLAGGERERVAEEQHAGARLVADLRQLGEGEHALLGLRDLDGERAHLGLRQDAGPESQRRAAFDLGGRADDALARAADHVPRAGAVRELLAEVLDRRAVVVRDEGRQ